MAIAPHLRENLAKMPNRNHQSESFYNYLGIPGHH